MRTQNAKKFLKAAYGGHGLIPICARLCCPDGWYGSPSSQYEWSTQHSPKIPVDIVYFSLTGVKIRC